MSFKDNSFMEAYHLWSSFKEEVLYKNRFNVKHEVLTFLTKLTNANTRIVEEGKILYRARIYTDDDTFLNYLEEFSEDKDLTDEQRFKKMYYGITNKEKTGFWGYGEKESFVPPNNDLITDGRLNPAYIKYLYTAENAYTALVEVRPYLNSKVSISEIRVEEPLKIANFSYESIKDLDGIEEVLMYIILESFSKPSDSNKKDYIPIQYITEFVKNMGVEGVRYNSSLDKAGRNITIFNYEKCNVIGSKLYEVNDIFFEAKQIAPKGEETLMHEKIRLAKQSEFMKAISKIRSNNEL